MISLSEKPAAAFQIQNFNLKDTLDCGQAFRWRELEDGSMIGVAGDRIGCFIQQGDRLLLYENGQKQDSSDAQPFWEHYFDVQTDYTQIRQQLMFDPVLEQAVAYAGGIRILRQNPWETLCSFIISQNNNIPRIKGILERFCECFGKPLGDGFYGFPAPETIAKRSVEDLAPLRAGFRAKYLLSAAQKYLSGEVDFEKIARSDLESGEQELRKIYGVGAKVAQCVLLFGFHKLEAFPVDTWIKKVLEQYYPGGFPMEAYACQGVAQQYLFHYIRNIT